MQEEAIPIMSKKKLKHHGINREWCKGCGICVALCPKNILVLNEEDKAMAIHQEWCIACRLCEKTCPDLAIEVITEDSGGEGQ